MKKIMLLCLLVPFVGSAQLKDLIKKAKQQTGISQISGTTDIGAGLKEALQKGVNTQVSKLTAVDGFNKNEAVRILMPAELQKVDQALRKMGMGKLADEGIVAMNRAAEDAVKESTPIFVNAIKSMTISDAKGILMGSENAATSYLQTKTSNELYGKFEPVVQNSIGKVGADVIWNSILTKYNSLPLVKKVNPDMTDYVTQKALSGVFTMIAVEEKEIRTNTNARSSELLRKVFAMQDKKKNQ